MPSGASSFIGEDFGIAKGSMLLVLPISFFLIGYVVGPILIAPLSEFYGRKWIALATFAWYFIFSIACALSPNMASLIVFRFLCGLGASAPLSLVGAVYADIWDDPGVRGRCKFFAQKTKFHVQEPELTYK